MTAAMELMEKLLHEADTKFDEKLRYCQNGVATNMNIYSDRTYNLRQQIAHNPQLLNDDHFMTMLQDTETALAPEFTIRGDVDKKLTSLLCGLLKTLLRETISQQIFSLRKIQIEMVWQWYEDKKRQVLDFAIGLGREAWYGKAQAGGSREADTNTTCRSQAVDASSSDRGGLGVTGIAVSVNGTCDQSAAHNKSNANWRDDTTATSKYFSKLKQVVTEAPRAAPAKDLTIHDESAKSTDAANIAKKFCLYKKRNLGKAEKLRQEFQAQNQPATTAAAATTTSSGGPASPSNNAGAQQDVRVVYTKDAKARQKKVAEAKSSLVVMRHGPSGPSSFLHHDDNAAPFFTRERTLENAVATAQLHVVRHLTHRLAQESDRRELKDTMTLFDFNKARLEEETNRRIESEEYSSQLGRNCHTNVRRPAEAAPMHFGVGVNGKLSVAESTALLGHVAYTGTAVSLSPYDVRKPSRMDETRLQEYLKKLKTPASRLSVFASDPRSIVGGSAVNIKLDVTLAPEVKVTTCGPRVDVPIVDLLLGNNDGDSVVPSLRRLDELKLASRVREAFAFSDTVYGKSLNGGSTIATNGLKARPNSAGSQHHYSRAKIEAAIVTPDDLSYDECLRLLPTYGSFLPRRPATAKK